MPLLLKPLKDLRLLLQVQVMLGIVGEPHLVVVVLQLQHQLLIMLIILMLVFIIEIFGMVMLFLQVGKIGLI